MHKVNDYFENNAAHLVLYEGQHVGHTWKTRALCIIPLRVSPCNTSIILPLCINLHVPSEKSER
jgi:hypothetical protein